MTVVRGLSKRDLDRLIREAEAAFAAAVAQAFKAATKQLVASNKSVTASLNAVGGMDVTDVAIAQQMWAAQVPGLTAHIGAAYGQSATAVGAALYAESGIYIPDPPNPTLTPLGLDAAVVQHVGGGVPVVARMTIDRAAREHLATAANRLVNAGDAMWADVRAQLTEGFTAGEGIRDITARLNGVAEISRSRAETIARTEVISASNAGALAGARAIPEIAPATKIWLATGDARTRPSHREADGQVVPLDEPFDVGGYPLDYPGADGPAEEVVNCRCTVTFGEPAELAALSESGELGEGGVDAFANAAGRRESFAGAWGVSQDQLAASLSDVSRLRAAVRAEASTVQADALRWLDQADAMRIRRPPRGAAGGEYDWIHSVRPAERERLNQRWLSNSAIDAPDIVLQRAQASGLFTGDSVDEFMEVWMEQTRRADAAGVLRTGRLPNPARHGGVGATDISTVLEQQGLDIHRVMANYPEDAAGYLASTQQAQYAEQAYSLLGPAASSEAPAWRMSFQSWEAEVRDLEAAIGEADLGGSNAATLNARYQELVPSNLDHGQSYEALYAEQVEMARVARMDVADYAVIPWEVP